MSDYFEEMKNELSNIAVYCNDDELQRIHMRVWEKGISRVR